MRHGVEGRALKTDLPIVDSEASPAETRAPLLQTQASIQRGRDIDHVYAVQKLVPGRRSTKCQTTRSILPHRDYHAGNIRRGGAALKSFLNARLFRWRSFSERSIHWDDDDILSVASQMRHLKGWHRVHVLPGQFSHVLYTIPRLPRKDNVDSVSSTVEILSLREHTSSTSGLER